MINQCVKRELIPCAAAERQQKVARICGVREREEKRRDDDARRAAATAFGVLISMTSPRFIKPLETATEIRPSSRWIVETPDDSVIVKTDRSRAVTVAFPPSSTRTID